MNKRFSSKVKKFWPTVVMRPCVLTTIILVPNIFFSMLAEKECLAVQVLRSLKVNLNELRNSIEEAIPVRKGEGASFQVGNLPLNKQAEKVLKFTYLEAKISKEEEIHPEHLLLSIMKHHDNLASSILEEYNVDYETYKSELDYINQQAEEQIDSVPEITNSSDSESFEDEQGNNPFTRKSGSKSTTPVLDNYGRDVTRLAEEGKLDPIVGREQEIERVSQILSRRKKQSHSDRRTWCRKDSHCGRTGPAHHAEKGIQNTF